MSISAVDPNERENKAVQLLLDFIVDLKDRIKSASFEHSAVKHFWSKSAKGALEAVESLEKQILPQLHVRSESELSLLRAAIWRSERALRSAEGDEFIYADWLHRASIVLMERLWERDLLLAVDTSPRALAEEEEWFLPADDLPWRESSAPPDYEKVDADFVDRTPANAGVLNLPHV